MESIIEKLWHGNLNPQESGLCETPEMKKQLDIIEQRRIVLEQLLNEEQKQRLEQLLNAYHEFEQKYEVSIFSCGFQLGAKLALEL